MDIARRFLHVVFTGVLMIGTGVHAASESQNEKNVVMFYDAFARKDPTLLDRILAETWLDIPPAPGQPPGPAGARQIYVELTTAFPDLDLRIQDVIRSGNKVVVRSVISGTHRGPFAGFAPRNRKLDIQAIDIHEFKDGKIARTWHTEDWLTGLHQMGVFEK